MCPLVLCDVSAGSSWHGPGYRFGIPELVAAVSQHITLMEGDLILTGTPAGVGPLVAGDTLEGGVELGPHSSTFSFSVMQEM